MATLSSYVFNNTDRIHNDLPDQSQRTLYNTRFANYTLSSYFSDKISDSHVNFATAHPSMLCSGTARGAGLGGSIVDADSYLILKTDNERPLEKLQLVERPFLTVPYLGRGSVDPTLESQLLLGEPVSDKKSVSTIMDKSFAQYALYPTDSTMEERVKNPSHTVEEAALSGWVRGGAATRDMSADQNLAKNNRPNSMF
jgi:hypothetical protein